MGVPLGDVRGRQPGDHLPAALGQLDHLVGRRHREEQVAVCELDPLGRAGRPRGVDQRQQIVGSDGLHGLGRVELRVHLHQLVERVVATLPVNDDHLLEGGQLAASLGDPVDEGLLGDHHLALGVREHVLDLLGSGGLVDREGDRPQRDGGQIARDELPAVVQHDRDGVAPLDAELRQSARDPVHGVAELGPAELLLAGLVADGEVVAEAIDLSVESLDQVRRGQLGRFATAGVAL